MRTHFHFTMSHVALTLVIAALIAAWGAIAAGQAELGKLLFVLLLVAASGAFGISLQDHDR